MRKRSGEGNDMIRDMCVAYFVHYRSQVLAHISDAAHATRSLLLMAHLGSHAENRQRKIIPKVWSEPCAVW